MSKKRTLDSFFGLPNPKKRHVEALILTEEQVTANVTVESDLPQSDHTTYPFPIPKLTPPLTVALSSVPAVEGKAINDQPQLNLLYFQPYIPKDAEKELFEFLRRELFFYRVQYKIKRGSVETQINTPR